MKWLHWFFIILLLVWAFFATHTISNLTDLVILLQKNQHKLVEATEGLSDNQSKLIDVIGDIVEYTK